MTILNWAMWFIIGALTALAVLNLFASSLGGIIAATVMFLAFVMLGGLDYMTSRKPKKDVKPQTKI